MNKNAYKASIDRVLKRAINEMGLTKAELARELNISNQRLNNWIKREKIPGDVLPLVSKVIGKSLNWIYSGIDTEIETGNEKDTATPTKNKADPLQNHSELQRRYDSAPKEVRMAIDTLLSGDNEIGSLPDSITSSLVKLINEINKTQPADKPTQAMKDFLK